jgi:hypothetical protein
MERTYYYHGTARSFESLKAGSWVTAIPGHAICQAEIDANDSAGVPVILVVAVADNEIRRPGLEDRSSRNLRNDPADEAWVRITVVELAVVERIDLTSAKRRFLGPANLLPAI